MPRRSAFAVLLTLPLPVFADESLVQQHLDLVWILVATALVFFMQAGFAALESGMSRAKNTINVAIKNLSDFLFAAMSFWLVGYGLMFGASSGGWFGASGFLLEGIERPYDYAFFLFQLVFAGTAATIVSGAVAERMQFKSYIAVSAAITALIYPISGHWIWADGGWLAELGFIDFAGSTVVHSVGAWVGLAGALLLGPRLGRFDEDGRVRDLPGHSLLLTTVGVFILWFGWFGFNGGSTLVADGSIAKVLVNTMLSAAAAGVVSLLASQLITGNVRVERVLNGTLGGLVGITAGCAVVEPSGAVAIGIGSGLVVYAGDWLLLHALRIDDPVGAVPVHGLAGAFGTLALALLAPLDALEAASRWDQLLVQLLGVTVVFAWAFGLGLALFLTLKAANLLRVPPEDERLGLNASEHGARTVWLDTMRTMQEIVRDGDLRRRTEVEFGTEAGETAVAFNGLLDGFQASIRTIGDASTRLAAQATQMAAVAGETNDGMRRQRAEIELVAGAVGQMSASVEEVARSAVEAAASVQDINDQARRGMTLVGCTAADIQDLAREMDQASHTVEALEKDSHAIGAIVEVIRGITDQTNLLALNAAIEAARAGEQGKGFAVVAGEVRRLAERTREATGSVQTMIEGLQARAQAAADAMTQGREHTRSAADQARNTDAALRTITQDIERIARVNEQVASATEQQSLVADEIQRSITSISEVARSTAVGADQAWSSSQALASLAADTRKLVGAFRA